MKRASALYRRVQTGFWRAAAFTTGLAVVHRRRLPWLAVAAVSVLAFGLGRSAGELLRPLL